MNPTIEELNRFSAEAIKLANPDKVFVNDKSIVIQGCVYFWKHARIKTSVDSSEWWNPAEDLSQGWKWFVPVLIKNKHDVKLLVTENISRDYGLCCQLNFPQSVKMETWTDKDAAYALAYAFCKAMKPKKYLTWVEKQEKNS